MSLKQLYGLLASPWYRVRPIGLQSRSKETWLSYCKAMGKSPDGVKK